MRADVKRYILILILLLLLVLGIDSNHKCQMEIKLDSQNWEEAQDRHGMSQAVFTTPLGKGVYEGSLSYEAQEDGEWEILDMDRNNGENELGDLVKSGKIQAGTNDFDFWFVLDDKTDNLKMTIYAGEGDIQVFSCKLENMEDGYLDSVFLFLVLAAFTSAIFLLKSRPGGWSWIFVIGMGTFLASPVLGEAIYWGDDIYFHLNRILGIAQGMQDGQFPVRMNYFFNYGYGFINPILYPELFLYIPAFFCILGASIFTSYKIFILLINITAAIVSYSSFKGLFKDEKKGLLCTFFYLLIPYRIANFYARAAIGEALAAIFLPLLFLGVYELLFRNEKKWYLAAIAASGIIQSHILSVELSVFFCVLVFVAALPGIFKRKEWIRFWEVIKAGIVVIAVNTWFLLPFLEQCRYEYCLLTARENLYQYALTPWEMFVSFGKYPVSLGLSILIGSVGFIYLAYYKRKFGLQEKKLGQACLMLGGISCYMASIYFPWRWIQENEMSNKILGVIQFPWRLLGFGAVFFAIILALFVDKVRQEKRQMMISVLVIISLLGAVQSMGNKIYDSKPYLQNRDDVVKSAEYIDYYRDASALETARERGNRIITEEYIKISQYIKEGGNLTFFFQAENVGNDLYFHCPFYNYGAYKAYLDGEEIPVYTDSQNMVMLQISKQITEGQIQVQYVGRKLYRVGDLISVISAFLMVCFWGCKRYKSFRGRKKTDK